MSYLSDVPVIDSVADSDYVLINQGRKTRQVTKADFLEGASEGGSYSIEYFTATSGYVLPDTTANEVWIKGDGSTDDVTIPNSAGIPVFTKYRVYNSSTSSSMIITLGSGVTIDNASVTVTLISPSIGTALTFVDLYKLDGGEWLATGDLLGSV